MIYVKLMFRSENLQIGQASEACSLYLLPIDIIVLFAILFRFESNIVYDMTWSETTSVIPSC